MLKGHHVPVYERWMDTGRDISNHPMVGRYNPKTSGTIRGIAWKSNDMTCSGGSTVRDWLCIHSEMQSNLVWNESSAPAMVAGASDSERSDYYSAHWGCHADEYGSLNVESGGCVAPATAQTFGFVPALAAFEVQPAAINDHVKSDRRVLFAQESWRTYVSLHGIEYANRDTMYEDLDVARESVLSCIPAGVDVSRSPVWKAFLEWSDSVLACDRACSCDLVLVEGQVRLEYASDFFATHPEALGG